MIIEVYIVAGLIVSGTFALVDIVFPKGVDEGWKELEAMGMSSGWKIVTMVVTVIITTAFWPLYVKRLLFPYSKKKEEQL